MVSCQSLFNSTSIDFHNGPIFILSVLSLIVGSNRSRVFHPSQSSKQPQKFRLFFSSHFPPYYIIFLTFKSKNPKQSTQLFRFHSVFISLIIFINSKKADCIWQSACFMLWAYSFCANVDGMTIPTTSPIAHNVSSAKTSTVTFHFFGWISSTFPTAFNSFPCGVGFK